MGRSHASYHQLYFISKVSKQSKAKNRAVPGILHLDKAVFKAQLCSFLGQATFFVKQG
jgi:hypothetical protein